MVRPPELARAIQDFFAEALAGTTLRNMGPRGTVQRARSYLKTINLAEIRSGGAEGFPVLLDRHTASLAERLPGKPNETWGVARKSLNLFFRDAAYNFHLREYYSLAAIEGVLEIPLDSYVGTRLRAFPEGRNLPRWKTVKGLTATDNAKFQAVAKAIADRKRWPRIHLDLLLWRNKITAPTALTNILGKRWHLC